MGLDNAFDTVDRGWTDAERKQEEESTAAKAPTTLKDILKMPEALKVSTFRSLCLCRAI